MFSLIWISLENPPLDKLHSLLRENIVEDLKLKVIYVCLGDDDVLGWWVLN